MQNEEKIIKLLEEIRDQQKENVERVSAMQKKALRKVFWFSFIFILLLVIIKIF